MKYGLNKGTYQGHKLLSSDTLCPYCNKNNDRLSVGGLFCQVHCKHFISIDNENHWVTCGIEKKLKIKEIIDGKK